MPVGSSGGPSCSERTLHINERKLEMWEEEERL